MRILRRTSLLVFTLVVLALPAAPSYAQDCNAMVAQIDELLKTVELTDAEKEQVYRLRDQGMEHSSQADTDCSEPLSEALQILQSK
ncbi:hypothetical protein [Microbaculum sp. FT89]|uniref:hypothetical protein n=1 Tax=Microbaculum sp. FT89 TaxID=3447298 RepID=UPI003F52A3AC